MINGLKQKAKIQAIMDLISSMDDLESEKLMPKMGEDEPPKSGMTVMKIEKESKPVEMELEIEPKEEMDDTEEMEDPEEEIDPSSSLARLKKKLAGK